MANNIHKYMRADKSIFSMITWLSILYIKYILNSGLYYISCVLSRLVAFLCRYILILIVIHNSSELNYILLAMKTTTMAVVALVKMYG